MLFWPKNERKKWQFFPFLEENLTRLIHLIGRERRIVVLVRKGPGAGDTPRLSLAFLCESTFYNFGALFLPFSHFDQREPSEKSFETEKHTEATVRGQLISLLSKGAF